MDLARSYWWYRRALGFLPAGERRHREGDAYAAVPGLPEASFDVACLIGRQDFFKLEMFEFARPRMRGRPHDWRPCDMDYTMFSVHVVDFDETLQRIEAMGGRLLSAPLGEVGRRRVCLTDPDGTLLELMADQVLGAAADRFQRQRLPAIASVTISVPSVDAAREFWIDVLSCAAGDAHEIHDAERERLSGLEGAERRSLTLSAGDVAIELVEYSRPRGKSRPPVYLLSDQGNLNAAFGSTDEQEFASVYGRAIARGFKGHREPWTLAGVATVVYLTDNQGMSVELLHVDPAALERMGSRYAGQDASFEALSAVVGRAARNGGPHPDGVDAAAR